MTTSSLDRALRRLGDQPGPAPDAAFAAALEDRLRAVCHLESTEPAGLPQRPAGRRSAWLRPLAASGAALAVFAVAVAFVRPGGNDDTLRVAAASNSVVVLPDGTVDAATPGLLVPDGTKIVTGEGGHVVAGEVELGPGTSGIVKGGAIQPASGDPLPPTPKPVTPSTRSGATPTTSPRGVDPPTPPVGPPPGPDPGPATPTTMAPARPEPEPTAPPPATPPETKPAMTTDTKPATEPTSTAVRNPTPLKLEAIFSDTKVRLSWSAYTGADFAAYLILRADAPAEPGYPVDERTTVVARITTQSKTESPCSADRPCGVYFDTIQDPAARSYRVVAVDKDRRVIGYSAAVRPTAISAAGAAKPTAG